MGTQNWRPGARAVVAWLFGMMLSGFATAAPTSFTYVGELSDPLGYVDANVDVEVAIYGVEEGGAPVWGPQAHAGVEVWAGLFRLEVGDAALPSALLGANEAWLEFVVDGTPLNPRQMLGSVPKVAHARHARRLGGLQANAYLTAAQLAIDPARAGTSIEQPTDPTDGETWWDATQQLLYVYDTSAQAWDAINSPNVAVDHLPTNGIVALSNGVLSNEFVDISHLWSDGAMIEDATIVGPGNPAIAEVLVDEAEPGYLFGLTIYTHFSLSSANNITMTLFPPPATGVAPIVLRHGSLTFGPYSDVWSLGNTPALAELLGANPSGVWTLAVVDNDNNLASPAVAGNLNSLEVRYDIVRADELVANGLLEADTIVASVIQAGSIINSSDTVEGPVRLTGELRRNVQFAAFNNNWSSSGNATGRTITFAKRQDQTRLLFTYHDNVRNNTTGNADFEIRIGTTNCASPAALTFRHRTPNSTNGYKHRPMTWTGVCERWAGVGTGDFIPAGQYTFQVWVSASVNLGITNSPGSLTVEEIW